MNMQAAHRSRSVVILHPFGSRWVPNRNPLQQTGVDAPVVVATVPDMNISEYL